MQGKMTLPTVALMLSCLLVASVWCEGQQQANQLAQADSAQPQPLQKRSVDLPLEEDDNSGAYFLLPEYYAGTGSDLDDDASMDKRSSLLRFGKRGSLFRFGKRGSLFRFGKRGSLFRFGKRGSLFRFGKRGSLFRFGKRDGSLGEGEGVSSDSGSEMYPGQFSITGDLAWSGEETR